jgi:hypothetical protein
MRQNNLLSPWRVPRTGARKHDGAIITQAANQMWGTDGARIFTLDQGWGWLFTAVEHWNVECVGWHVGKVGSRFAILEPIPWPFNTSSAASKPASPAAWPCAHGHRPLSQPDPLLGIFGPVSVPIAIYGRAFRNLDGLRDAAARFVDNYNHQWLAA